VEDHCAARLSAAPHTQNPGNLDPSHNPQIVSRRQPRELCRRQCLVPVRHRRDVVLQRTEKACPVGMARVVEARLDLKESLEIRNSVWWRHPLFISTVKALSHVFCGMR
jgi:hypothetical protein